MPATLAHLPPVVFQALEDPLRVLLRQVASPDYYHIQAAQQFLVPTKALSNETLDAIALHGPADLLTRDRQAKARRCTATLPGQHGKRFAAGFLRMLEYAGVITGSKQAHVPLESQTRLRVRHVVQTDASSGKAGSTFGTPGFDDFAARLRRHAGAKAVPPLTLQSARLIWSFHCTAPVAPADGSLAKRNSQKGLNANVTFHCLSIARASFHCYGLDPTTVIHSHPLFFSPTTP